MMKPVPAEAIFDLPRPKVKPPASLNKDLTSVVASAFPREQALLKRRVIETDGLILSQYARVAHFDGIRLRTFNIDLLLWLAAGLDSAVDVIVDPTIASALADAGTSLPNNFKTISHAESTVGQNWAILADRADIIAFADTICNDITSDQTAYLIIYDVIELAARELLNSARQKGIDVEIVPGPHSYIVVGLGGTDTRTAIQQIFRNYIEQIKMAPEYLRPRVHDASGQNLLGTAFANLLVQATQACQHANSALGSAIPLSSPPELGSEFVQNAANLAKGFLVLLDKRNASAAIGGREYRPRAQEICDALSGLSATDKAKAQSLLLEDYQLLWKFFHLVSGWRAHSIAENETFRLALDKAEECVVAPKAFKPFSEYIFHYRVQDFKSRFEKPSNGADQIFDRSMLAGSLDHVVRKWQLVSLIEMMFTMLRQERPHETLRWLDLGCGGRACAANCVQIENFLPDDNWEVVSVDWNKSAIDLARRSAKGNRTFLLGDVKEAVAHIGGGQFNIVSAFEFVEHLEDPVKTLKNYLPLCSDFFIAGSPLEESQSWLPSPAHIWAFDRKGYEATINAAGFTTVFANEAHVGKYARGHDWVTVIGGKNRSFPFRVGNPKHSDDPS